MRFVTEARRGMSFFEGLAYLFRFDVLSANWRSVLSSFSPTLIALGISATPLVADLAYKEMKKLGWVT